MSQYSRELKLLQSGHSGEVCWIHRSCFDPEKGNLQEGAESMYGGFRYHLVSDRDIILFLLHGSMACSAQDRHRAWSSFKTAMEEHADHVAALRVLLTPRARPRSALAAVWLQRVC